MHILFVTVSPTCVQALHSCSDPEFGLQQDGLTWETVYVGGEKILSEKIAQFREACPKASLLLLDLMGASTPVLQEVKSCLNHYNRNLVLVHGENSGLRMHTQLGQWCLQQKARTEKQADLPQTMKRMARIYARISRHQIDIPPGILRDLRNHFWICAYWRECSIHGMQQLLRLIGQEYGGIANLKNSEPPQDQEVLRIQHPAKLEIFSQWNDFYPQILDKETPRIVILYSPLRYPVDTHHVVQEFIQILEQKAHVVPIATPRLTPESIPLFKNCLPPQVDLLINLLNFRIGQGPMGGDSRATQELLKSLNIPILHPFFLTRRSVDAWQEDPHGVSPSEFLISIFLPEMDGCIETIPIATLEKTEWITSGFEQLQMIPDRVEKVLQRSLRWHSLRHKPNHNKRLAILLYDYPPGKGNLGQAAFLNSTQSLCMLLKFLQKKGYNCPTPSQEELITRLGYVAKILNHHEASWLKDHDCIKKSIEDWGEFPGHIACTENGIALPGWLSEHCFLGIQPARKQGVVSAQDYHQEDLTPHHQYLATYRWIEQGFKADAIIHIGTHGTMEFTPGKECALSQNCYPDYLIGNLPHLYIYYSGNPSEAMIAKRRSHAVMIGHLHAPLKPSGLYGDMQSLQTLLEEHAQAAHLQPSRQQKILEEIHNLCRQLDWPIETLPALHEKLENLQNAQIPGRMHTLGQPFSQEEALDFLSYYIQIQNASDPAIIRSQLKSLFPPKNPKQKIPAETLCFQNQLDQIQRLYTSLTTNQELDAVTHLLEGKFLTVALAGDPYRNPEVLPSGRNLIQFDPRHVPSPAAERAGIAMAKANLQVYVKEHGVYPKKIAVVLWGLETSKTQGESVAQILHYLGVQLERPSPWVRHLRLIPLQQLNRPRVDVQIQISGFLRDLFPHIIEMLDEAMEMVAQAEESDNDNPIRIHTQTVYNKLLAQGKKTDEAWDLAKARIFGPKPGVYGTGVPHLVKSREWKQESDLAECYLHGMRYVYTRQKRGDAQAQLQNHHLRQVQMVSQVRSGMDHEITDLDHYYEFLGGIQKSVEHLGGKTPLMRVCDSLQGKPRSESLRESIQRGVRTRLLNPVWQQGMLESHHHGAQQMATRMENLLGLAALTHQVDQSLLEEAAQSLILNPEMGRKLEENNPLATQQIMERMLEIHQRGYWQTSPQTLQALQEALLDLEGDLED